MRTMPAESLWKSCILLHKSLLHSCVCPFENWHRSFTLNSYFTQICLCYDISTFTVMMPWDDCDVYVMYFWINFIYSKGWLHIAESLSCQKKSVAKEPKQNYRDIKSDKKSWQKYVPSLPLVIFQADESTSNILLCVLQTTIKYKWITS